MSAVGAMVRFILARMDRVRAISYHGPVAVIVVAMVGRRVPGNRYTPSLLIPFARATFRAEDIGQERHDRYRDERMFEVADIGSNSRQYKGFPSSDWAL
jgi:hypothetical protein